MRSAAQHLFAVRLAADALVSAVAGEHRDNRRVAGGDQVDPLPLARASGLVAVGVEQERIGPEQLKFFAIGEAVIVLVPVQRIRAEVKLFAVG